MVQEAPSMPPLGTIFCDSRLDFPLPIEIHSFRVIQSFFKSLCKPIALENSVAVSERRFGWDPSRCTNYVIRGAAEEMQAHLAHLRNCSARDC